MASRFQVRVVRCDADVVTARRAIRTYGRSLGVDLGFQEFDREIRELPGDYAPPNGELWIAWEHRRAVGVVALRSLGRGRAELKRLYVSPRARGRGLGMQLTLRAVRTARRLRYRWLYLDTLASMTPAIALYERLGFRPTRPYRYNPIPGSRFFRLRL